MSPRLRPKNAVWLGRAVGRLVRLHRLSERKVAATLALERDGAAVQPLLARIAEWEAASLRDARRQRRRGAHSPHLCAGRLRLRPCLSGGAPELRMIGDVSALTLGVEGAAGRVCALFRASPVILPAAGLVTLEFRLLRLAAR